MANIDLFDVDLSLKEDTLTKDIKEIYNEDVINQSIDIFVSNPYRIGVGLTNQVFDRVYTDIVTENLFELEQDLVQEFQENFNIITVNELTVEPINGNRALKIQLFWTLTGYELQGTYRRIWST